MKTMKPIKTEYKGVVFDSKSEAVFARALELAGNEWVYHPATHCGHEWDFLVFPFDTRQYYGHRTARVGGVTYYSNQRCRFHFLDDPYLIEYKPSLPTETYIDNLRKKVDCDELPSWIVYGSPFAANEAIYKARMLRSHSELSSRGCIDKGDFLSRVLGVFDEHAVEAMQYRFDLVDQD